MACLKPRQEKISRAENIRAPRHTSKTEEKGNKKKERERVIKEERGQDRVNNTKN